MDENALKFLKELTESFGPAGYEREVSIIVRNYASKYSDEIKTDKLGSLVIVKKGSSDRPRILLAGHVDEVGFVVSGIDEKTGFLSFNPIGGWWDQVLLGQRVVVRTRKGDHLGVISAKPPHLLKEEELKQVLKKDAMFIDIGTTSKEEALDMGVRIGDPVMPWSPFTIIRNGKVAMGKAFDDRIGAFVAIETLRALKEQGISHPNTVYAAATVQEEVGLRGATTTAHITEPDVALVWEVDIAGDVPGIKSHEAPTKIGKGPSILTFDSSMIPNQQLKEVVISTAEEKRIPHQISIIGRGGTDAGKIHLNRAGCPSIVLGVPTRHIHSHVGLLSLDDVDNAVKLNLALIKRLDEERVRSFTDFL